MGKVNIDDLKSGMVLAHDLFDFMGRYLLGRGAVLDDRNLQMLKSWGITEADIEGVEQEDTAEATIKQIDPVILKRCEEQAALLFRYTQNDHEVMQEIKRLSVLHMAKRLSAGESIRDLNNLISPSEHPHSLTKWEGERLLSAPQVIQMSRLTSFPDIYHQIVKVLGNPMSSGHYLAEVISKDTTLSARLLRLANSAYYGLPYKVDSITRAIAMIGINDLSTLAMGVLVLRFFRGVSQAFINMKDFWLHSIACGTLAGVIAHYKTGKTDERYFVAGLLHDVGRIPMVMTMPRHTAQAIRDARMRQIPLYRVETEVFGFDHSRLAALLLKEWKFPATLEEMTMFHHKPATAGTPLDASIIHLADIMALAFQFGHSGELFVPPLAEGAWEEINLSLSVLAPALSQTERLVNETVADFIDG